MAYQANKAMARIISITPATNPAKNPIVIRKVESIDDGDSVELIESRISTHACSVSLLNTVRHCWFSSKTVPLTINVGFSWVNSQVSRALVREEAVLWPSGLE